MYKKSSIIPSDFKTIYHLLILMVNSAIVTASFIGSLCLLTMMYSNQFNLNSGNKCLSNLQSLLPNFLPQHSNQHSNQHLNHRSKNCSPQFPQQFFPQFPPQCPPQVNHPLPPKPCPPKCPTLDTNNCCDTKNGCPPFNQMCAPPQPICTRLAFREDFRNFQDKLTSAIWSYAPTGDLINILADDGRIIQECDGATFDSNAFTFANTHPFTTFHLVVCKSIPFSLSAKGVCAEFTASQITKYVSKIRDPTLNNPFDVFYECSGTDPETDPRLAYSAVRLSNNDFAGDLAVLEIMFSKKKIYVSYGIDASVSNLRDRFRVMYPIMDRAGLFDEKFIISMCLNYDGSAQVYLKDPTTCAYKCVLNIANIGVPPTSHRYITSIYAKNVIANPLAQPVFLSDPITFTNLFVCVGNLKRMQDMEPNPPKLSKTVLYNVTGDVNNVVYRYLCECGNTLLPAETTVTLPDGTPASTAVLNYGQGAAIKLYNLDVCYM